MDKGTMCSPPCLCQQWGHYVELAKRTPGRPWSMACAPGFPWLGLRNAPCQTCRELHGPLRVSTAQLAFLKKAEWLQLTIAEAAQSRQGACPSVALLLGYGRLTCWCSDDPIPDALQGWVANLSPPPHSPPHLT